MKQLIIRCLTLLLISTPLTAQDKAYPSNGELLKQVSKGFAEIAKKSTPAVVYIESQSSPKEEKRRSSNNPFDSFQEDFFNRFFGGPGSSERQRQPETSRGSGFIITDDGYIMTNNHVVEDANKVSVSLHDGRKLPAKVVGTDPRTDLALIKIDEKDLPYLPMGDSDALEPGEWTIAIGTPFGLQATVTVGVVSAKGRNQLHLADYEDFIQTDAAINPGNSGGPLLNVEGEVIGVNTAIVSGSGGYMGIGFAIPINMASLIMDQLMENGSVTRGFLGVTLQPIDSDLASFYHLDSVKGAFVTDVVKGSPADDAGLKQEDIIIKFNGENVESISTFRNAVSLMKPGAKLALVVIRNGKEKKINVTITALPETHIGPQSPSKRLGLSVEENSAEMQKQFSLAPEAGVVITKVEKGSPADEAGLKVGSLIVAVNRKKIANLEEYNELVNDAAEDGRVLLMIKQGEAIRFVALHFEP